MGSFADFLENELLDHVFGAAAYTAPATLYIGFSTTTITDAGGNITEPSGNNYSRIAVTNNATNFPAASGGAKSNGVAFTSATASGSWGTLTDVFISDASSGGNVLAHDVMTTALAVGSGGVVNIAVGELDITLD